MRGTTKIEFVEKTVDASGYIDVLFDALLPLVEYCCCVEEDWVTFQHDNANIYIRKMLCRTGC